MNWIKIGADLLAPLDEPLQQEIINSGEDYCDESTVKTCDKCLPNKNEKDDDVEDELHYFRRWMYCHHAGPLKLTQFVFFGRGRSPQAAKRLARLLSHFANCKDHHLDSFTYLCDVFRRIKNTAKEDLVYLLEHRWQPMPALALA